MPSLLGMPAMFNEGSPAIRRRRDRAWLVVPTQQMVDNCWDIGDICALTEDSSGRYLTVIAILFE